MMKTADFLEVMRRDVRFGIVGDVAMGAERVICRACKQPQYSEWGPSPTGNHMSACPHYTMALATRRPWWTAPFVGDSKYVQDPASFPTNEAAKRLGDSISAPLVRLLEAALTAERRAMVERIAKAYRSSEVPDGPESFYQGIDAASANLFAILDEEASR
jgi:hypothetical protein